MACATGSSVCCWKTSPPMRAAGGWGVARLLHYQALDGLRHGELRLLL
ncbi:hypothetical protein G7B21_29445, partial [Klebsiella pneumoniae]|nr:hypothetical protein [Klebsiella pneumoniae]